MPQCTHKFLCSLTASDRGHVHAQNELSRNHCRPQRIDIWQQAVDTDVFNPAFRSQEMRARMSGGKPDSVILTYVGQARSRWALPPPS